MKEKTFFYKIKKQKLMMLGFSFILFMFLVALFAPYIATHDPNAYNLENRYLPPSGEHLFGTDENGGDVFSKVVYGARVSISVSLIVVLLSALIGLILGSLAGFWGGLWDRTIMRLVDVIYAFPGFLLALALVAMLGPAIKNVILALCLTSWVGFARLVRGEVLYLKEREYVQGAVAVGASSFRVLFMHIWPNIFALLIVQCTLATAGVVIAEAGLSFLGLGAPVTTPTWGALLNSGRKILLEAPHVSVFPGLAIIILVLGFNFIGDGLRNYLDPKYK